MAEPAPTTLLALDQDSLIRVLSFCSVRDVLALGCACKQLNEALKDDLLWRQLAEQKWGPRVRQLARVEPGGWSAWTRHRLSATSSPVSPLDLVQELYQDCPFQHMLACAFCSRTSGGPTVRGAIRCFLETWPTPSAVLDAPQEQLLEVLRPLGLPHARLGAALDVAHGFLATDWEDPSEFKHCGKFVSDSFHIFCRRRHALKGVEDKTLQRYLRWRLGMVDEEQEQQQKRSERKRKAEKPAEAGTLRSGRRRAGPGEGRGVGSGPRRETRASAAAAAAAAKADGEAAAGPAPKGRRGATASRTRRH
ncbi:Methyl- -binding domain 4 [Chlorella sorokiniana]|uniref:Methyl--binding domain 4 n=1 Tax=Chlorella sorokiniana TaxID=3076 RepID=A0A2P6TBV8_CHLSO|nr:Methyl- -binding domain 4 [Chlorella sorokiniana]|eukprot:PRW18374.1 Methyl- -binding domain 4 [Chlorella sorokiniana]